MLMPIVSVNKMAMNESVAMTCCFQEVASPTNVYWEVLNGGWIGSGFVETKSWKHAGLEAWAKLSYDIAGGTGADPLAALAGTKIKDGFVEVWVDGVNVWWEHVAGPAAQPDVWLGGVTPAVFPANYYINILEWFTHNGVYSRGDNCKHEDPSCRYLNFEIAHLANRHWDSTKKHDTKTTDWSKPHEAKRFHS